MTATLRLPKLVGKLENFVNRLEKENDLGVHKHINNFYYMQKITELTILQGRFADAQKRVSFLSEHIEQVYAGVLLQWYADLKWLTTHQMGSGNQALR